MKHRSKRLLYLISLTRTYSKTRISAPAQPVGHVLPNSPRPWILDDHHRSSTTDAEGDKPAIANRNHGPSDISPLTFSTVFSSTYRYLVLCTRSYVVHESHLTPAYPPRRRSGGRKGNGRGRRRLMMLMMASAHCKGTLFMLLLLLVLFSS